jgi:tetratricopeptide (TPR) repeat protein
MRTLELLKSLSKKELKLIEEQVLLGKRKTLVPLFKELKKFTTQQEEPARPDLYKKTFGHAYAKNKDYLLRNELRLLNEIVYELLATESFKEHSAKNKSVFNRWLAQSFHDRRMPVFAEDINGFLNYAKEHVQLDEASAMFALRSSWASSFPISAKERDREKAVEHVKEWKYEEERRFLHRVRKIEFSQIFFEKFMKGALPPAPPEVEDWSTPGANHVDLTEIDKTDWYTRYLTLQKYYTQSKGNAQLNYLQEMIKLMGSEEGVRAIKTESRIRSTEALALNLFMNNLFKEAHQHMQQALKLCKTNSIPVTPPNIIIYISILLVLDQYHEALKLYEEFRGLVNASVSRSHGIVVAAYCYLFLAKPDEAWELLKQGIELQPAEMQHSRYIYMIVFILRGQYDLALTEVRNLKRMLASTTPRAPESDTLVAGYFQTYIRVMQSGKGKQKTLEKLKKEVTETISIRKPSPFYNLQLNWLAKQLKARK